MSVMPRKRQSATKNAIGRDGPKADILRCSKERRYSITSSAPAINDRGPLRPIALAVLSLISSRRAFRERRAPHNCSGPVQAQLAGKSDNLRWRMLDFARSPQMSNGLQFDEETSRKVESLYVAQRGQVLEALALRKGERVLDIGSGPGLLAYDMAASVGRDGRVCGIDIAKTC
jgi:hypothetical protein